MRPTLGVGYKMTLLITLPNLGGHLLKPCSLEGLHNICFLWREHDTIVVRHTRDHGGKDGVICVARGETG